MPKLAPPKIRLAGPSMDGAEVYNFYQLISMLSSLYVKALDRKDGAEIGGLWDTCAASILSQIGMAHDCWGLVQARKTTGIPLPIHDALVKRSEALAKRLYIAEVNLNQWLSVGRWSKIILRFESQIQSFSMQLMATDPFLMEKISSMNELSDSRLKIVQSIEVLANSYDSDLQKNYALPVLL